MLRWRQITQEIYRLTAPQYEAAIGPVLLPLARDLAASVPLAGNASIVDLGTGTGFVLRSVAAPGRRCIGVDLSLPMLRAAATQRAAQGWPNTHLLQGDAFRLTALAAWSCDAALASFSLGDGDPNDSLRAIHRVLRPGGRLCLQEWGPYDRDNDPRAIVDDTLAEFLTPAADGLRAQLRALLSEPSPWQARLQDAEDYAAALSEMGFLTVEAREFRPVTLRLPVAAFMTYALAWAPRALEIDALSPDTRKECLCSITHQLEALAGADHNLAWSPLILRATGIRRP